jgi:hypothetical protein
LYYYGANSLCGATISSGSLLVELIEFVETGLGGGCGRVVIEDGLQVAMAPSLHEKVLPGKWPVTINGKLLSRNGWVEARWMRSLIDLTCAAKSFNQIWFERQYFSMARARRAFMDFTY